MADVRWLGKRAVTRQVTTATVGSATSGHTFPLVINGKSITYTAGSGETTATVAAGLYVLAAASDEGEFAELTWSVAGSVVTATGPTDGAPFTLSTSGGTGTLTMTTPTVATSPNDAGDGANWSTGSLPTNSDRAVFDEPTAADCKYRLTALTAVTCTLLRRTSFTGVIGLPDTSPGGYPEYRPRRLEVAGTSLTVEQAATDREGQVRVCSTSGSAVTVTVLAPGGRAGTPAVELSGLPGGSTTLSVAGAGVVVSPAGAVASGVSVVRVVDAAVELGAGTTVTTATAVGGSLVLRGAVTGLTVDRGAEVTALEASVCTTVAVDGGAVRWQSTGSPGQVQVAGGGEFDLSQAPAAVAVTLMVLEEGARLTDPAGRLVRPYDLTLNRTELALVQLDLGTHFKLTVDEV